MTKRSYSPVTSYDVAKLAGVSQSAVSRTFSEGGIVSATTRAKVKLAAEQLGYRPSFVARSLITRRSNLIGVVVPGLANPFYAAVLDALSLAFNQTGYRVLLFSMQQDGDTDPILEDVLRHRVEALIMVSSSLSSKFAEECLQNGLPVLLLNRKNDNDFVSSVTSDNFYGGETIAEFVLAAGHKRPAFIAGLDSSSTSRDRENGFTQRLICHGLTQPIREKGMFTIEGAMSATRRLMELTSPPDIIFCANDIMAIGALNVITGELNLTPGKEISIIGFDNIAMSAWPNYNLTTYIQPMSEMVTATVSIISTLLSDKEAKPIQKILPGQLIIRSSAKLPDRQTALKIE